MDVAVLPFNLVLGIVVQDNAILLQPKPEHLNHVNTIHATVLYGIAEAAAGLCLLKRFPELSHSYVAVLRSAEVKYRRPGHPAAELCGIGTLPESLAVRFEDTLESRGRATLEFGVAVSQNGQELFTGSFNWFATRK